jgi:hypothetical protein
MGVKALALGLALAACSPSGQTPAQSQAQPDGDSAESHTVIPPTVLNYACTDGLRFTLNQDTEARAARLTIEGRDEVRQLEAAVVASGYAYVGPGTRFHAKDDGALLQLDSDVERTCNLVSSQ